MIRATPAAAGYGVEVFSDGAATCARLAGPAPDLVVLDLHLPKVLGIEVFSNSFPARSWLTRCKPAQLVELVRSGVGGPAPGTA